MVRRDDAGSGGSGKQATLVPLAKVEGGPAILGKHCQSYYGNCSPWERQGMQVVTSE